MKLFLLFALLCNVWGKDEASPTVLNEPSTPDRIRKMPHPEVSNRLYTEKGEFLYQGDMILNTAQYDAIFGPIQTRKAIDDLTMRWTNAEVPYRIGASSEIDRAVIVSGIQHWEANTCLKFFEVDEFAQEPHLIFEKNEGCNAYIGMQTYYGQVVSIGEGCESMGTVVHEIGHAIGFYHEQSRPDRGQQVKVLHHNINETMAFNFDIPTDINNHGVPYDLGSIMQYGPTAFTKNGQNTMAAIDVHRTYDLGQDKGLSFYDVKLTTIIYKCADHCTQKPRCQNNGFVDFKCQCRCPPGFVGSLCERRVNIPAPICGGDFNYPTTIRTPNYPNNYPVTSCIWIFKAPAGKRIRADFHSFDLISRESKTQWCMWDHLEIRTNNKYEGEKYCFNDLHQKYIESSGNEMGFFFQGVYNWNTGFEADVTWI